MTSLQKLKEFGESIGLKGEALHTFIKEQQAEERAARVLEREKIENDKERAEKEKTLELEKLKLQIEQQKLEQQAKEKENEHELKRLKLDKQRYCGDDDDDSSRPALLFGKTKMPKMPFFDENIDCMDSYLNRFERFADAQGWKEDSLAMCLSALLRGKALDVYSRLPPDQANDYDSLKQALLKRYQLSEDGFKRKFRTAKPDVGEPPAQFLTRLASYLQRWVELAKVEQTFEGLAALIIREQYLSVCPQDLALFLKERMPTDIAELAKLAEQYYEAHTEITVGKRHTDGKFVKGRDAAEPVKKCFKCGSTTHLLKNCKQVTEEPRKSPVRPSTSQRSCFICGKVGHLARNCFQRMKTAAMKTERQLSISSQAENVQSRSDEISCSRCKTADNHACSALLSSDVELKCGCKLPVIADACRNGRNSQMPVKDGWCSGKKVTVLRDTGCSTVVVRSSLVSKEQLTGEKTMCVLIDGTVRRAPVANIYVESPYLSGKVRAVCMEQPLYDIIIGNVDGAKDPEDDSTNRSNGTAETDVPEQTQAIETRQQKKLKPIKALAVPDGIDASIPIESIAKMQADDESLKNSWQKVQLDRNTEGSPDSSFFTKNGLLYRQQLKKRGLAVTQLVLPEPLRRRVMKLAHESIMAGHQGITRTQDRVSTHFWWPCMTGDIQRYCRSCDICQRTVAKGRTAKVPLGNVPLVDTPFKRVAVDLVGPMFPATDRGNRYLLTLVDYSTRYPEAVALKNVETETVAEALVSIFARIGIPSEILSDQGAQFVSNVMKEVSRLLSIKQLTTTPYHPQCNGLVERFNGTLKMMLKRMCAECPRDWDRYVDPLLFAYREVPQESLGFSPFEMLYGHSVRGPMLILKQLWTKEQENPDVKSTYQHVIDLRQRLQDTCDLAHQNLLKAQAKQKKYFDCRTKERHFKPGDKVLLLLPTDENKLLMNWKGPFEVLEQVNERNYLIQLPGRTRLLHANLLKKYFERETISSTETIGAAILEHHNDDKEAKVELWADGGTENYRDVKINPNLTAAQTEDVKQLVYEYREIFTDVPNVTTLGEHQITLTSDEPIRGKAYPLPHALREALDKEIASMLKMDVIEPSTAAYASPVVMVKKPDGSTRVCVDYRKLNQVTVFDPEPIPSAEEIFVKLAGDKFFSKFDLTKGYWQVPMREEDKDLTTFICHQGLFRFKVMPFGLVNAPATFSRIMRRLLRDSHSLDNYLDDVLAHTGEWLAHLTTLRNFFDRVKEANLTLRPTKCEIGEFDITFLGHRVAEGELRPKLETVEKVLQAPRPCNKKQLRAFLGLVGFYRRFIPNFAAIASPLTDATRKGAPNHLEWGEMHERSFSELKKHVVNPPILKLPNFDETFILQTDASDVGIGALIAQEDDNGTKHPIAFASRKLLPRETRYSTIEKECLAIVWAVTKFQDYLYGKEFLLETDHQPLQYLGNAQYQNGRLMRWALALQPYRFVVRAIHGRENVGADFLSRLPCDSE